MAQTNPGTGGPQQTSSNPSDTHKEVSIPTQNTDKQVFDRTLDSSKEVYPPSATDTSHTSPTITSSSDTEKEVPIPTTNTDKEALTSSAPTGPPILALRFEKSTAFGLILPQNQTLALRSLDPTTRVPQGLAFTTSKMIWLEVCSGNPPSFELFTAHDLNAPQQVAAWVVDGWQGIVGMRGTLQVQAGTQKEQWDVARKGVGRNYAMTRAGTGAPTAGFVWKGSTKTVKEMVGNEQKVSKGNFKLTTADGAVVLALWQQSHNSEVLGDLLLYQSAKDVVAAEVIVASCVCVVLADRALGLNWFGGMGK